MCLGIVKCYAQEGVYVLHPLLSIWLGTAGQKVFQEALVEGHTAGFFKLIEQFRWVESSKHVGSCLLFFPC